MNPHYEQAIRQLVLARFYGVESMGGRKVGGKEEVDYTVQELMKSMTLNDDLDNVIEEHLMFLLLGDKQHESDGNIQ